MKHKSIRKLILILLFISFLLFLSLYTGIIYAKYSSKIAGVTSFGIAKPICKVYMDENIYISNYGELIPTYFSVCNYDEYGKQSEVGLEYFIKIVTNQSNAPLKYSLFREYNDGSEEKIEIDISNGIITTEKGVIMQSNVSNAHRYRLEAAYDSNSSADLINNFAVDITINSEQIKPKKQ